MLYNCSLSASYTYINNSGFALNGRTSLPLLLPLEKGADIDIEVIVLNVLQVDPLHFRDLLFISNLALVFLATYDKVRSFCENENALKEGRQIESCFLVRFSLCTLKSSLALSGMPFGKAPDSCFATLDEEDAISGGNEDGPVDLIHIGESDHYQVCVLLLSSLDPSIFSRQKIDQTFLDKKDTT